MEVRSERRGWVARMVALAAIFATSSCLLTSNFDGLTGNDTTSSGASMSSANGGAGGRGGAGGAGGASSTSSGHGGNAVSSTGGTGGSGGSPCMQKNIGGAFPATCVLDDFNRPDGDPGANWQVQSAGDYTILNDELVTPKPSMPGDDIHPGSVLWSDMLGPTQEVFFTLSSFTTNDGEIELLLKAQGGPEECGSLELSYQDGVLYAYYCEVDQGNFIELPQGSVNVTFHPGDQFGARATVDGTLTAYKNGQLIGTWDSTAFSAYALSGRVGIETDGVRDQIALDDFGGGGQ